MVKLSRFQDNLSLPDGNGDTLLHILAKAPYNQRWREAFEKLAHLKINPQLCNSEGKRPLDLLPYEDPRWQKLKTYTEIEGIRKGSETVDICETSKKKKGKKSKKSKAENNFKDSVKSEQDAEQGQVLSKQEDLPYKRAALFSENVVDITEKIKEAIEKLTPESIHDMDKTCNSKDSEVLSTDVSPSSGSQGVISPTEEERPDILPVEDSQDISSGSDDDDEVILEAAGKETYFDNLTWEVDCTEEVWKVLRNKKLDRSVKRKVIDKIQTLAQGTWRPKLCKLLEGPPKSSDILLYEAKITKAARIIWEQAIAFSPRCSDDPKVRVKTNATGGRIYTDIIRVWDVVLDHETLSRRIKQIVKSHDRGLGCLVKKTLKGLKGVKREKNLPKGQRIPNYYIDESENQKEEKPPQTDKEQKSYKESANLELDFFPPASSLDNEYNILKFYSFNSTLINSILEESSRGKIDFPFKVTELEHAIINIRSELPVSIILLGRSGTGKTTCCLYRLWNEFQSYWEGAATGGPQIPRHVEFIPRVNQDDEKSEDIEDKEEKLVMEQVACSNSGMTTSDKKCALSDVGKVADSLEYEDREQEYEHLHQIFVTKNAVLCSEVKKNFKELCHACPSAQEHIDNEMEVLPPRIQDIHQAAWPLFISSRDWLLLLDASLPGDSFFPRNADGTLKRRVIGWGEESEHLTYIPADEDEDEDDEDDELHEIDPSLDTPQGLEHQPPNTALHDMDPRTEVTYTCFKHRLWPKMNKKKKTDYHPTLVWTEIRSFIKGSVESLHTDQGYLSLDQYVTLGRKRAPYFSADRKYIYKLFQIYQHLLVTHGLFDEPDMIFQLYVRLQKIEAPDWSLHRVYVDETQDFSQAELTLFIRCCRFPNHLFFTGDTAQSIMRGISFRFEDLKSLFYYANKSSKAIGQEGEIRVPDSLYQLTHNYRSHAGILELASSVIDLLLYFFPSSFDRLDKDQGLFDGPKPVLLESCRASDLAVILSGNSNRASSHIEFGAHQVILVSSDEARRQLPEELSLALVLTIYEAKGLEFNDVLIYNFFKDSQAKKEWRVISEYLKNLQEGKVKGKDDTGLVRIHESQLSSYSRPLTFDPDKHKVLNSEFKYLYTAITRARQNVWIFDEDVEGRTPMFEYFQRLGLVNIVKLDGDGRNALPSMFAQKSSLDDWNRQGLAFFAKELWSVALQCFEVSSNEPMVAKCNAHLKAEEARLLWQNQRSNSKKWKDEFLSAADQFLDCKMPREASICLNNAKEFLLLAKLEVRLGNWERAAKLFRKEGDFSEASRCYEKVHNYRQAVEVLYSAERYEPALSVVERYTLLKTTDQEAVKSAQPPKKERTIENLVHTIAKMHLDKGNVHKMEVVIQRLPTLQDQITFLKENKCVDKAARLMIENDQQEEAAIFLFRNGRFLEARENTKDPKFIAECCLSYARKEMASNCDNKETIEQNLDKARILFEENKNQNGIAEVDLSLGKLNKEESKLYSAYRNFFKVGNTVGVMECLQAWMDIADWEKDGRRISDESKPILHSAAKILRHLQEKRLSVAEQQAVVICEQHFGLLRAGQEGERVFYPLTGCRMSDLYDEGRGCQVDVKIPEEKARKCIASHVVLMIARFVKSLRRLYRNRMEKLEPCKRTLCGYECSHCSYFHGQVDEGNCRFRFQIQLTVIQLNALVVKICEENKAFDRILKEMPDCFPRKEFESCLYVYNLVFPVAGGISFITQDDVRKLRQDFMIREYFLKFASSIWKGADEEKRVSDTDLFLKVSNIIQLAGKNKELYLWLVKEQDKCTKRYVQGVKSNIKIPSNIGIAQVKDSRTGKSCQLYMTWWEDMKQVLLISGNVLEASHLGIRRFLGMPVSKTGAMPYPSIANIVSIAEFFLTLLLGYYSRLPRPDRSPNAVCLPESYSFSIPKLWNSISLTGSRQHDFFKAIEVQPINGKRILFKVWNLLSDLIWLIFGGKRKNFNTLWDALQNEKYSQSGEAERTLILALTFLCNCGKGVPSPCEELILSTLYRIEEKDYWSGRIREAVAKVQVSRGTVDIVETLQNLLRHRSVKLYDMQWKQGRLYYLWESKSSLYSLEFHIDISQLSKEVPQSKSQKQCDHPLQENMLAESQDEFPDDDLIIGEDTYRAREELTKEVRAVVEADNFPEKTAKDPDITTTEDEVILYDESGCQVCNVTFRKESHGQFFQNQVYSNLAGQGPYYQIFSQDTAQAVPQNFLVGYNADVPPMLYQERNGNENQLDVNQLQGKTDMEEGEVTQSDFQMAFEGFGNRIQHRGWYMDNKPAQETGNIHCQKLSGMELGTYPNQSLFYNQGYLINGSQYQGAYYHETSPNATSPLSHTEYGTHLNLSQFQVHEYKIDDKYQGSHYKETSPSGTATEEFSHMKYGTHRDQSQFQDHGYMNNVTYQDSHLQETSPSGTKTTEEFSQMAYGINPQQMQFQNHGPWQLNPRYQGWLQQQEVRDQGYIGQNHQQYRHGPLGSHLLPNNFGQMQLEDMQRPQNQSHQNEGIYISQNMAQLSTHESMFMEGETYLQPVTQSRQDYSSQNVDWFLETHYPTYLVNSQQVNRQEHLQSAEHHRRCRMFLDYANAKKTISCLLERKEMLLREKDVEGLDGQQLDEAEKKLVEIRNRVEEERDWDKACVEVDQPLKEFEKKLKHVEETRAHEEEEEYDEEDEDDMPKDVRHNRYSGRNQRGRRQKRPKGWKKKM